MKYTAIIDTDKFSNFKFFEDADGKYLVARDANAEPAEWLPLHFTETSNNIITSVLNKLRERMEERDKDNGGEPLNMADKGYHLAVEHLSKEIDTILNESN